MEPIKVTHKIKLGFTSNLLIASLAGAIFIDGMMKAADYVEKHKLVTIGKSLEEIVKKMEKKDKKTEEKEETEE